jgi:hypothetical protein
VHLTEEDRRPPDRPDVFFDPVDTEAGIWATVDLLEPGRTVLDLGSGSGAAAAAVARAGASHVHGLDISAGSVEWACERYGARSERVSFAVGDYTGASATGLLDGLPFEPPPDVVSSNPPYVPVPPPPEGSRRVSVDGGPDGLRLVALVVRLAAAIGSDLALTIGSYSSPRAAACLLRECGYRISSVTLSALALGAYTVQNMERVAELERRGQGPLLRTPDGIVHYLVLGLSCRRVTEASPSDLAPEQLLDLLHLACRSPTVALEALDRAASPVPVRILVLPDEPRRHHC